jgi:hypothetical protein
MYSQNDRLSSPTTTPRSLIEELSQGLGGAGASNDVAIGFGYNPASEIVSRSLTNNAYEFPVTYATRSYAVNGLNWASPDFDDTWNKLVNLFSAHPRSVTNSSALVG